MPDLRQDAITHLQIALTRDAEWEFDGLMLAHIPSKTRIWLGMGFVEITSSPGGRMSFNIFEHRKLWRAIRQLKYRKLIAALKKKETSDA